jgi:hypothetical protein
LQLYDVAGRGEYSFASSIGTGSLHGEAGRDPKREVRTPAEPTAAQFRRAEFHPSKSTAGFTAASGQLSRPNRGRA